MTKSYRCYLVGQAISQFGDWLYMVGLNWLIIDVLFLSSWHGNLQRLLAGLTVLFMGALNARFPDRWSPRAIVLGMILFSVAKSGLLAGLCYHNKMSFHVLLVLSVLGGALTVMSSPGGAYFQRSMVGEMQHKAVSWSDFVYWLIRCAVGITVSAGLVTGTWLLFALDALSYLPLILIVCLVHLAYRKPEAEKEGSKESFWNGLEYLKSDTKTRFLFIVVLSLEATCAIVFTLVAEIIRKDLGGEGVDYGIMLALTGGAGLVGSTITLFIAGRGQRTKIAAFALSSMFVPLAVAGIGISGGVSLTGVWVFYALFTLTVCPHLTLSAAEINLVPEKKLGSVSRVKTIMSNTISPGLWFLISLLGWAIGLTASETVLASATFGLILTTALFAWGYKSGVVQGLFEPKNTEPQP